MKITKIDVIQEKSFQKYSSWRPTLCRIYTDEGIYGDGEAALAYGDGASGAFGMLKDFAKLIIGMNPLNNEVIWDYLYKNTFWGQNGGPVVFAAISAIDIALWDIRGKYYNAPIYQLLGGKRRDNLRCYASQLQFGWDKEFKPRRTLEDYREVAKRAVAEGYDAIKVDFFTFREEGGPSYGPEEASRLLSPYYLDLVESRVAAVRDAVGPNVDIIMENHSRLDAQAAIQIANRVEKYNLFCFEEPNTPSPKTAKYLAERINIPIAQGERLYARWQYAPYFEDQSIAMIQPDLGTCGGLTEGKKICDMAYVYDVSVQAHVCASPLSTAAALHLECVIPNFCIHEHHNWNLQDYNKRLCTVDWQPVNGKFKVPEGPGLGCEISEYAMTEGADIKVTVD
mgnify:CR=1 FL=1